jgi:UDP-N-acetylglucosamine/UDP-N-acetylgalactosamine diphosphorylase
LAFDQVSSSVFIGDPGKSKKKEIVLVAWWWILMAFSTADAERVQALVERGVIIPCPASVEVDETVRFERIAPGVIIHPGCRLAGAQTSIGPGCEIGAEAQATIENCQLGKGVSLKGGYFSEACFLDKSSMGSGAHVRAGTLLEEEASGAHTVGLKQTILLAHTAAGSLINFCDCLMAGGTSRKNHSEIGSSYIHFNFTPHQDKATASLIGDVPRGVMLDQPPIFLGGQGGLVGPVRIAYGTVIPAGVICRQDLLEESQLAVMRASSSSEPRKFVLGMYRSIDRIVRNNLIYIGNIQALTVWYGTVRKRLMQGDPFSQACLAGALARLESVLEERIKRLAELAGKMPGSLAKARAEFGTELPEKPFAQQRALAEQWPEMEHKLKVGPPQNIAVPERDAFLAEWENIDADAPYPKAIALVSPRARSSGTAWLQAIVDSTAALWKQV